MMNNYKKISVILFALSLFFLFSGHVLAASNKPIRFADKSWDSPQVLNRIAGFIIKHGYKYEVEYVPGETIILFAGLTKGDIDVDMEWWYLNFQMPRYHRIM